MKTFRKKLLEKSPAKAQSAMEYLMTYGWAILIIAVVLGALFQLGVFNSTSLLGSACIAQSGFYCSNPVLSTSGVLTVTVGQATGTTFTNTYVYFVPSGTTFSSSDPSAYIGTLNSGQEVNVNIPLGVGSPYPSSYTVGTPLSGYLYLQYTDVYGTVIQNEIGTVTTKVTQTSSSGVTFSQPSSLPSGITEYVPITLQNTQTSSTPAPFQQMIQISEGNYASYIAYNGNFGNFEFFTQSGSILPAWIESNNSGTLTVWVNLPNGIPASSSLTIYLGFASKTTNLLSSSGTSGIGEAPQLSSTYAQYDDGTSVFSNYWNFAGTSLPSGVVASGTVAYSINNGLTVSSYGSSLAGIYTSSNAISTGQTLDFYGTQYQSGSTYSNTGFFSSSSNSGAFIQGYEGEVFLQVQPAGGNSADITSSSSKNVFTINFVSTSATAITAQMNYGNAYAQNHAGTLFSSYPVGFSFSQAQTLSPNVFVQWLRVRAYPPNGVMPSVSFGGVSS